MRIQAFEARNGQFVFVPDPERRGRYFRTSWYVTISDCPACMSAVGVPCRTPTHGFTGSSHADRLVRAKELLRQAGVNVNSASVNEEPHPVLREDVTDERDGADDVIGAPKTDDGDGVAKTTVDLTGLFEK